MVQDHILVGPAVAELEASRFQSPEQTGAIKNHRVNSGSYPAVGEWMKSYGVGQGCMVASKNSLFWSNLGDLSVHGRLVSNICKQDQLGRFTLTVIKIGHGSCDIFYFLD